MAWRTWSRRDRSFAIPWRGFSLLRNPPPSGDVVALPRNDNESEIEDVETEPVGANDTPRSPVIAAPKSKGGLVK